MFPVTLSMPAAVSIECGKIKSCILHFFERSTGAKDLRLKFCSTGHTIKRPKPFLKTTGNSEVHHACYVCMQIMLSITSATCCLRVGDVTKIYLVFFFPHNVFSI